MNKTIDLYGADDKGHSKRPFTISFTEESSPAKKFNLRYLLAQQYVKENRKKSQFTLYHITERDYYHPSYLPTRSPANLQMQNLNNTTKSIQSKQTQFSKSFNLKCKTLPLKDQNQQMIYKRKGCPKQEIEVLHVKYLNQVNIKQFKLKLVLNLHNIKLRIKKSKHIDHLNQEQIHHFKSVKRYVQ